jgi:1-acyl-sn-glycerol-3-phosphate acyltransferase
LSLQPSRQPTVYQYLSGALLTGWMGFVALVLGLACVPLIFVDRRYAVAAVRIWCRLVMGAARLLCGITVEVRGLDKLPDSGVLIAAKHQGMLDTVAPFDFLHDPSIVLKQELLEVPIYGWYASKVGMIPIDREGAAKTLRALIRAVRERFDEGRQIIIFPEGTRKYPGAAPDYKPGIAALYKELRVPCSPVATNSGMHWPPHGLAKYPGKVVFEVLDPIPAGLKRAEFMRELETRIETATARLVAES